MNTIEIQEQLKRHLHYLEQDPDNTNLLMSVGVCYRILNELDEAVNIMERLFKLDESNATVAGMLAMLHFDNNVMEPAEFFCKIALVLDADNREGRLVQVLLRTLSNEAVQSEIDALLLEFPEECRLWFALGTVHMQQMNVVEAGQAFARATEIWPGFYDCWISLAWCQLFQNDLDAAEHSYEQAMKADEEQADAFAGMALVSALRKEPAEATPWLEKARSLNDACFLIAMAEVIMANEHSPGQAADRLMQAVPGLEEHMELMLARGDGVLH